MADLFLNPYVRATWRWLHARLGASGRMVIFGAGAHTRWLLSATKDMPALPIEAILDDNPVQDSIGGIEVRRPDTIGAEEIDLVLISSDRWEQELFDRSRSLWGDSVEIVRLYDGLPVGPYDKSDDRVSALEALRTRKMPEKVDRVVLVSDRPGPREAKLGFALSSSGCQAHLLYRRSPRFDASEYFSSSQGFNNEWEALRWACDFAPSIYHISVNGSYRLADRFLQHRPGPIVVDPYDCIAGMLSESFLKAHPDFATEIELERTCLERADGVCARSREVDFLVEHMQYRIPSRLLFVDGCWDQPVTRQRDARGHELHTVYAGHVEPVSKTNAQSFGHGSRLWLAQSLADQGVHFHLYPWCELQGMDFDDAFAPYRDLERSTPFFHLHQTVGPDRLIAELAQYDLAMFAYNEDANPDPEQWNYTPNKFRYATSNKVFDFLDAGLPIAYTGKDDAFITRLLDKYGVRIDLREVDHDHWGDHLRSLDLGPLRDRARGARKALSIRQELPTLLSFYRLVLLKFQEHVFGPSVCSDGGQLTAAEGVQA